MASQQQLKGRIRSVKSTKQITKAMQMVAASKMRRAQEAEKASLPYTQLASEILTYLASQGATEHSPLFEQRDVENRMLIVITSDKGLAGAYNSNVFKTYLRELQNAKKDGQNIQTIAIGQKIAQFASRLKDVDLLGSYTHLPDDLDSSEFGGVVANAVEMFREKKVDAVDIVFTEFISSINQETKVQRILPAGYSTVEVQQTIRDAKYEPDQATVLEGVAYRLVAAQLFQAMLDARASEHSMRMIAMKNATDNASDLVDDLTLAMNKARQAAITQELAEISSGAEAMK